MAEQVIFDTLLRELRRLNLYPPEERQLKDLRSKIERKFDNSDNSPEDIDAGKYAVLLYGLALKALEAEAEENKKISYAPEKEDSATIICLDYLALMGTCGRMLAAQILCNKLLPLPQVKEWLSQKPDRITIAVADRMLALEAADVPKRVKLAQSITEKASAMNIADATCFFKVNGTRKGQLTFRTLENFMTGRYGLECRRRLIHPETLEEITTCTESMPSYPDKNLVEDVAFHLRTMDPIVMEKVLRTVERLADEVDSATLKEIIPHTLSPSLPLAKAAMDVIAKFGRSKRGRIFAQIFNESPRIRAEVINRLPLLSSDNFAAFMGRISDGFHTPVLSALFSTLSEEDSHRFGSILSAVLKSSTNGKKNTLKPVLNKILKQDKLNEPEKPVSEEGRTVSGLDYIKLGAPIVLNIEKKQKQTGFKRIFGKETAQPDSLPDIYTGGQISNQRIHKLNRWKSQAQKITFQNCRFAACDFRDSFMETCIFKNCSFDSCSFGEAVYRECEFADCTFSSCSLNETTFYNCSFDGCSFQYSHFDSAVFSLCSIELCEFTAIAAPGSFFCRCRFISCEFNVADFREAFIYKSLMKGLLFIYSEFSSTLFSESEVRSTVFHDCSTLECKALGIQTDSAQLLNALQRTLAARLCQREQLKKRSNGMGNMGQYERGIIYKAIKRWFAQKDIDLSHARFAENNSRRLEWTAAKMNSKRKLFLYMLPALLHSDVFEQANEIEQLCMPSHIDGYSIPLDVIRSLKGIFPDINIETGKNDSVPIKALMSIGSTGTIAQTPESDIDCWVCCDFSKCPPDSRERLQFKLRAVEEWAANNFDLELHFFTMDVKDIRENKFGLSDEESSGSAQSAILKEEFYRTALLIAGRPPLWWFTPVEADEKTYAAMAKKTAVLKGTDFCVDLGNVPRIPMEEFFGASLWQIVKGVKSPFKSIMKFGLLEMYTSSNKYCLLCESVKKNILAGMRGLRRVDPYMLLYKELADFYKSQEQPEYKWLTAMALRLKCGLLDEKGISGHPTRPEEKEIIEFATGLSGENSVGHFKAFKSLSDFRSVVTLGEKINLFMIKTYMKVRGEQDKISGAAITPEDLARLGRIVFSNFAKRKFKVARISLPGPKTHFFDSLIITRDLNKVWEISGEYPDESGARNIQTRIESGKDLTAILIWLVLNGLYDSKMRLKTDLSSAPLRDRDLKKLFANLTAFFPRKTIFNTPVEETLNSEQMRKAYFIINLCAPRESNKIQEVHLVYSTNWGEVFCKPVKVTAALIESPERYLQKEMADIHSGPIQMGQFVPPGSECPSLKIPVR
ncbi:class I adenylate cyclase [Maridesulfovibrio hydrothermalis]|uniref:Putative adenylate cyclase n=1 Tax=Maridesulfovibrio hydrothermalis AM13 = DSM 14728 TaxID=1121451 RepID=L0R6Z4_9BACT|nr:class I adenylate cyclase [Maridesulfovibrio hydrothermalis]CCO22488.1 putative adenylate cyclase [Maridesulfovibrio hydrothermalis AM13 = DSM 14728]